MKPNKTRFQRLLGSLERALFINADIELPKDPEVYFVATRKNNLLYIGQTLDLNRRWKDGHHRIMDFLRGGAHYIYYQYTQEPADLEKIYLDEYKPPYNRPSKG